MTVFKYLNSRILLVLLGIGLGLTARWICGEPASGSRIERRFIKELPAVEHGSRPKRAIDIQLEPDAEPVPSEKFNN